MLDRLVDNWLDKASERSFQRPFAHILAHEGHTILHITRHCAMEAGKDILTLDSEGRPCAFQLKGAPTGKIKLNQWRKELHAQAWSLVTEKLVHPSVTTNQQHRSFLVTNGEFEEEVIRAIDDFNRGFQDRGQHELRLDTIVGGDLKKRALALGKGLWPEELMDMKLLLTFLLDDGDGMLAKSEFAKLLESLLPLADNPSGRGLRAAVARSIASAALYADIALSNFSLRENHVAEIEGWALTLGYVLAAAQRYNLKKKSWEAEQAIAKLSIRNRLENLAEEIRGRDRFREGDPFTDKLVFNFRITYLLGLLSVLWLWRRWVGEKLDTTDAWLTEFVFMNIAHMRLWSEAAIPCFLAVFWMFRKANPTPAPDVFLHTRVRQFRV